jgi:hypothetical protein
MPSHATFVDGSVADDNLVKANWLNDVNSFVYNDIKSRTAYASEAAWVAAAVTPGGVAINPSLGSLALAPNNIVVNSTGAFTPRNSALYISGTMSGTGTGGFVQAAASIVIQETITETDAGSTINGLYVSKATGASPGKGNRNAASFVLGHNHATGASPGDYSDGLAFHTACFATTYVTTSDGGTAGFTRGDFYGFGGVVTVAAGSGLYVHGAIGAEFDVSVEATTGVEEKMILQLVMVNNDAVKGSIVDAAIVICGDPVSSVKMDYGLVFGKPGNKWPVSGTIIGTYATSDAKAAVYGIDFSAVTFSGGAFKSNGFIVGQDGGIVTSTAITTPIVNTNSRAAPASPPAGQFFLYMDSADNILKAKGPSGTVTSLANP